jgi:hypothetical protein
MLVMIEGFFNKEKITLILYKYFNRMNLVINSFVNSYRFEDKLNPVKINF